MKNEWSKYGDNWSNLKKLEVIFGTNLKLNIRLKVETLLSNYFDIDKLLNFLKYKHHN